MKMKHYIYGCLTAVLLSGCGTYKHMKQQLYAPYERPEVSTQGIVRDPLSATDTLAVSDTTSFGNLPWRSVFTDSYLRELIEKGLTNNVDLLNAALNVKMAEQQLKTARLAFLPSFTFTPQGTISSWDFGKVNKTVLGTLHFKDLASTNSCGSWVRSMCRVRYYDLIPLVIPTRLMVTTNNHKTRQLPMGAGTRIQSEVAHTCNGTQRPLKVVLHLQCSLNR